MYHTIGRRQAGRRAFFDSCLDAALSERVTEQGLTSHSTHNGHYEMSLSAIALLQKSVGLMVQPYSLVLFLHCITIFKVV